MKNKIQHIISTMALTLVLSYTANAQTTAQKIGKNPTSIAPSAVLDIESDNKGVLFPRIALTATTDATTIASPATGLTVYNTATAGISPNNVTPGYYYWNGTKWTKVATEAEASKWSYDAINARVKLNKLSNGTTDRTGATSFAITDDNVLQIGDMTNVTNPALPERGIMVRKNGNASITSVSDGGIYSVFENQIYGGSVGGSAAYNVFAKSRGSLASPQAVQNGDLIGIFDYRGFSGTAYGNSARIMTKVEGAVTSTSVPVSFDFSTVGPGETALSSRLKISSNGFVGVGTSNPSRFLDVINNSNTYTGIIEAEGPVSNTFTRAMAIRMRRGTSTAPAAIQTNDVSAFGFAGYDGASYSPATAGVAGVATQNWTSINKGMALTLSTTANGTSAITEKMRVDHNGNVGIGTPSPANKLEITQGTSGNSGLRFTNLNSSSAATTSASKVLGLNSTGDVILTNIPGTQNIVDFSTTTPTTSGVVFTPNTPADESVVYQSAVDNSFWTYNGTTYVTYTAPASTAWNLANTTNDAGSNKTSAIWRSGSVGIGTNNPATNLHIQNALPATATANANAQVLRLSRPSTTDVKWDNIAQFNLGSYSTAIAANSRLDLALTDGGNNTSLSNVMTWQANGNVGIRNTAPTATLDVNSSTVASNTVNADVTVLKLARPLNSGVKFPNIAHFNLGSFTTGGQSNSRLDLSLSNINDTDILKVMTWQANGNVGIGTAAPSGGLTIFGPTTSGLTANILGKTGITKEILFGRGGATKGSAAIAAVDEGNFGGGLAFFTKAANGSDNFPTSAIQAMNIDWLGNVGIGNTSPSAPLVVQGKTSGAGVFKLAAPAAGAAAGDNWWMGFNHGISSTDADDRARIGVDIVGGGAGRLFFTTGAGGAQTRAMFIDESQRVGIGTNSPTSRLEVDGAATNKTAFNAAAGTTIDFSKSNLAYTTANPGNTFTLSNLKDGGTYTLAVQGTTAGTASFTATGFTFKSPNNGLTAAGKETIYTFMVMGSKVYFYMTTGI